MRKEEFNPGAVLAMKINIPVIVSISFTVNDFRLMWKGLSRAIVFCTYASGTPTSRRRVCKSLPNILFKCEIIIASILLKEIGSCLLERPEAPNRMNIVSMPVPLFVLCVPCLPHRCQRKLSHQRRGAAGLVQVGHCGLALQPVGSML